MNYRKLVCRGALLVFAALTIIVWNEQDEYEWLRKWRAGTF